MNDASVRAIRLPQVKGSGIGNAMARKAMHRLLNSLQIGAMIVHEGQDTLTFGEPGKPGEPQAEVFVHSADVYQKVLTGGALGSGEAYMQGDWSATDLTEVIRLFTANLAVLHDMNAKKSWLRKTGLALAHALNNNTLKGSKRNISAHYDLGNDFFELFLDRSMMYSSAVYPRPDADLEEAAAHKLDLLCQQLELGPDDHLLEIGTGWGGLAVHAASHYGCRVTTTTISREQYERACRRVKEAGLEDRITLLLKDYRELEGRYDKLVSVEMIEAVGHQFYSNYFAKCSELLKPHGLMAIQAITMVDQRYEASRDAVDFIKRYIFPGGCLPSLEVITRHLRQDTDMQMVHLRDITEHYADTLADWRRRFFERIEEVRRQGFDETFIRMWEFYLCYCEGGFRERSISTVQLAFAKPGYRFG
ncbi:MAG: cyclopropane-fatty-acyl-phospholipid synthase family protein [Halieaceae bacterium]|jgi:cyclopropane-fatty-acyl-phospholipid synthase|nr:cyclopropane-fatty-acyl-phospholipid synthase family protein [Halieaceae bacterium]